MRVLVVPGWLVVLGWLAILPVGVSAQEVDIFLSTRAVTAVAVGDDAVHWSSRGGAGSFRPADSLYATLTEADGLGSNNLTAIGIDASGSVWYGTDREGVWWISPSGNLHVIKAFDGLPSNEITSLDPWDAGVWIGTTDGASYFMGDTRVETVWSGAGLLGGDVLTVLVAAADSIWFGTTEGLSLRTTVGWEDHFAGSEVRSLVQDRYGVVWGAAESGLYRRDGAGWTQTSTGLPDPDVFGLVLADTVLWAGTGGGPAWYDENAQQWVPETNGLLDRRVTSLDCRAGLGVWVGTGGDGVAWWSGAQWEPRRPSSPGTNYLSDLAVDPDGDLWCGAGSDGNFFPLPLEVTTGGLLGFHDGQWSSYRQADSPLPMDNTYRVASDGEGGVWVGTWGAGLIHFNPVSSVWDTLTFASGDLRSPFNVISALVPGKNGEVWFGDYGFGIGVVAPDGATSHFGPNDGLPSIFFRSLAVDSLGRVWAGSYGLEGASDLPTLTRLDTKGTLADKDDDEIAIFSATLWGGSVPLHAVACVPGGGVWLGVPGGIAWTDGESWVPVGEACTGGVVGEVRSIAVDRKSGIWIAGSQGLGEWRDNTWTQYVSGEGGIAADDIMSLAYDWVRNTLWIGTWGGGVSRWTFELPDTAVAAGPDAYAYPNPFRPGEGHHEVRFSGLDPLFEIEILTIEGARIIVLPAGEDRVWQATNGDGEAVASGLYFFRGRDSRGGFKVGKVAVIR